MNYLKKVLISFILFFSLFTIFLGKVSAKEVNVYIPDFKYESDWFNELVKHNPIITKQEIHENPKGYLIQNTYSSISLNYYFLYKN